MAEDVTLDTLFLSARELGERIRTGKLTSEALTRAYLDRLEQLGPKLGAVVTVMRDAAVKEARSADAEVRAGKMRGPLHGVPYGAKDLLATKDAPTTWGAEPYRKQQFDHDATVIRKLRDAGCVLLGKLAMVELAGAWGYNSADASFTGPGRCPWNTEYWSGGSSSGSGAAVAAGLVGFAIGSETSGSIITPASYCGVAGLRPTYGRVSRFGAMPLSWTLDKIGPMARTIDDCALVLSVIAGRDRLDAACADRPFAWPVPHPKGDKRRWKIGVIAGATAGCQPEVQKNFEAALQVLEKIADIEKDVRLPDEPYGEVISLVLRGESASIFRDLIESGGVLKLRSRNLQTGGYAALTLPAVDYLEAMRARVPMKKAMATALAKVDAIVGPGRSATAYPVGMDFADAPQAKFAGPASGRLITAGNAVGWPAICVPTGLGDKELPTSIQFLGRPWTEGTLAAIAKAYQDATQWHKRRPPERR